MSDYESMASPAERLAALRAAMPTDPRGWWTGEEVDELVGVWERANLPVLVMHDAEGDRLALWTVNLRDAAEMLGLQISDDEVLTIHDGGDYRLYIEPMDNEKRMRNLRETSDGASA